MNLFLFGGTSAKTFEEQWKYIFSVVEKINPKQILFIPFASGKDNYALESSKLIKSISKSTQFLDAYNDLDFQKALNPLIFVIGGNDHIGLINSINANHKIKELIFNCENYVGESAGAMVAGEYQRPAKHGSPLIKGLGLLPDTIIEPHYTERKRHELLPEEMKRGKIKYGIGLDEATGIHVNLSTYPKKWEKIGEGMVEFLGLCRFKNQ